MEISISDLHRLLGLATSLNQAGVGSEIPMLVGPTGAQHEVRVYRDGVRITLPEPSDPDPEPDEESASEPDEGDDPDSLAA